MTSSFPKRIGFEYLDLSHEGMLAGYKAKGVKESPDASWYLQLVWTDPTYQGQGSYQTFTTFNYLIDCFSHRFHVLDDA